MANSVKFDVGVRDNASRPINNIRDAWRRLQADSAKGLAVGVGAAASLQAWNLAGQAIRGVTGAIGDSVKAAIEEAAGQKRLAQSIQENSASWDGNTAAIERTITARERLGFADDVQRDSLAFLVSVTGDHTKALDLQRTAMDLARLKGMDLNTASELLGKVYAGNMGTLSRYGIVLEKGATATEAIAEIQRRAAGQAEAYGDTTAGAMERAGIAVDNLREDFGAGLMPVVEAGANFLTDTAIPVFRDAAAGIGEIGKGAVDAIPGLRDFFGAFEDGEGRGIDLLDFLPSGAVAGAAGRMAQDARDLQDELDEQAESERSRIQQLVINNRLWADSAEEGGESSKAAAEELNDLGLTAQATAHYINRDLIASLNAIPTEINVDVRVRTDVGAGIAERIAAAGDDPGDTARAQADLDFAESERERAAERAREKERRAAEAARKALSAANEAERKRQQAADEAERERKRKADEAARKHAETVAKELRKAYDTAKRAARDYFDEVHDANLKAIDDVRDLSNAVLDEQAKAIRGALTAEEERIQGMRDAAQKLSLEADVANAETPEELRRAQEALNRFNEDQRLGFLRDQADEQIAGIEGQKDTNDLAADVATDIENERFGNQVDQFDRLIAAVQEQNKPITIVNQFQVDGVTLKEIIADYLTQDARLRQASGVSTGSMR